MPIFQTRYDARQYVTTHRPDIAEVIREDLAEIVLCALTDMAWDLDSDGEDIDEASSDESVNAAVLAAELAE